MKIAATSSGSTSLLEKFVFDLRQRIARSVFRADAVSASVRIWIGRMKYARHQPAEMLPLDGLAGR